MGQSLSLLTAALLVAQTPAPSANGKNCACKPGTQGRVFAQPEYVTETRSSWFGWRNSTTTTTESWRSSSSSEGSWIDNRPVLSRIKGWFSRDDEGSTRIESSQPAGQPVIVEGGPTGNPYYRRLPTTSEPPLGISPAASPLKSKDSSDQPKIIGPTSQLSAPDDVQAVTVEIAPIEFRPAGQAKGQSAPEVAVQSTTPKVVREPERLGPISPRFVGKIGQPGDYSWITGQLEIRGGRYLLHYATPDTVDRYNGSIELSGGDFNSFRTGDLVSTHGTVMNQGRTTVYQVRSIDLIER